MKTIHGLMFSALAMIVLATDARPDTASPAAPVQASIDHGRYLLKTNGCNECHTPGYTAAAGNLPESAWLVGSRVGYRGAWGTSYAQNLRSYFATMTDAQWLDEAHNRQMDPPMPYWQLAAMSDQDLHDIYAYVHSLGAAGAELPDTVPLGTEPSTSYILMTPLGGEAGRL